LWQPGAFSAQQLYAEQQRRRSQNRYQQADPGQCEHGREFVKGDGFTKKPDKTKKKQQPAASKAKAMPSPLTMSWAIVIRS
jgi:hypothetical protein